MIDTAVVAPPRPAESGGAGTAYRSASVLGITTIAGAGTGFVFWIVAARLFPESVVGAEGGALSLVMLVALLAQLDLHVGLPRFLPVFGRQRGHLIRTGYGAAVVAAVVAAAALLVVTTTRAWNALPGLSPAASVMALAAIPVWVLFSLQDSVLIGLRAAPWVAVENLSYNVAKLGLLVLAAALVPEGPIIAAVMLPALLSIPLVNYLIFRRLLPRAPGAERGPTVSRRSVLRFLAHDYPGGVVGALTTRALPLIVIAQVGTSAGAYFFIAWQLASVMEEALSSVGVALTVEAATLPVADATSMALRMLKRVLLAVTGLTIAGVAASEHILTLFGGDYAERGRFVLIALFIALPLRPIVDTAIAVMRLRNQGALVSLVQFSRAPVGVGSAIWLTTRHGIVGAAWSHVLTSAVLAVGCGVYLARSRGGRGRARTVVPR